MIDKGIRVEYINECKTGVKTTIGVRKGISTLGDIYAECREMYVHTG